MKFSAVTLALAGAAIASPVAVEEREIEARALPLFPVLPSSLVGSLPAGVALPGIPNLPANGGLPISPADVVPAVTAIIQSLIVTIANLLQGLPGNTLPIPGIGSFPGIPGLIPVAPTVPIGSLTPEQLLALAAALQNQLGNLTAVGPNLPLGGLLGGGLNQDQLAVVRAGLANAQAQLAPILAAGTGVLANLGNLGGALPNGVPNLANLQGALAALGPVIALVTGLLGLLTGGLLGNILGGAGLGI